MKKSRAIAAFSAVVLGYASSGPPLSARPVVTAAPTVASPSPSRAPHRSVRTFDANARATAVKKRLATVGPTLFADSFGESASAANAWLAVGKSCLTAGTATTPTTSIPACGTAAPIDAAGSGALQLTSKSNEEGMVLAAAPVTVGTGITVSFTDYAFNGSTPGADGFALVFTDGTLAPPTVPGSPGGSLGYANAAGPGIANGYLGIGFDEYGNFSSPAEGRVGGPGQIPETIAVRGAASISYAYLGGAKSAAGVAASLPFSFDQPTVVARPANAATIAVTLLPSGALTVSIDRHDGNGSLQYYAQTIVGVAGQPTVPAKLFIGLTSSTGQSYNTHQVGNFQVTSAGSPTPTPMPTPIPTPVPATGFVPTQIAGIKAWYDASDTSTISSVAGKVVDWLDKSGSGNDAAQANATLQPTYVTPASGVPGALRFGGNGYLLTRNAAFSQNLFNESTVFVVANQAPIAQASSVLWSGVYYSDPRWSLRLSEAGVAHFDFGNKASNRLSAGAKPTGPAVWTASGSIAGRAQYLRRNGNTLGTIVPTLAVPTNAGYPLAIGAMTSGTTNSFRFTGDVNEVVVYNRALSPNESATIEGFLACKWGLQNRLPANHAFRNGCPQGGSTTSLPTPPSSAGALVNPPELRSANKLLTFNVVASANASTGAPQLSYAGFNVPPTLRVLPGDTVVVNLVNNLPAPPAGALYLNDTNLHYHGLHVNPNAPGDDSIDLLAMPGQTLNYRFVVPVDHPSGLYWYHSHAHGEAERQNLAGMSGAIVVDGIVSSAPQVANMPERIMVMREVLPAGVPLPNANRLQVAAMRWAMQHATTHANGMVRMRVPMSMDTPVRGRATKMTRNPFVRSDPRFRRFLRPLATTSTHCVANEVAPTSWSINGQSNPSIGIRPGEQQFWRVVNAGSNGYLDLAVDNAQLQLVALDGVPVTDATGAPTTISVPHYILPPSSRAEFIVTGPPKGTVAATLRTNCFDSGTSGPPMPAATLAQIDPSSSLSDLARRKQRVAARTRSFAHSARYIVTHPVTGSQTVYYSDQNTINGASYDPAGPPQFYVQSGSVQEWTIVNNSSQVHTFHIHQIHFVVEATNGVPPSQQLVLDNVNVPPASANGPGTVKLLLDFTDPTIVGTFLLHCHILSHEDAGMMAKIRVGLAPPMIASPNSVSFASVTAAAQTVAISGGAAPYSVTGCANVANGTLGASGLVITPAGAGSCVMYVSDSTGLTVSIPITVQGAVSPVTVTPNTLSFVSPGAAGQTASIAGGTTPYALAGCSAIARASIAGSILSVAPLVAGSCSLVVTDAANNSSTVAVSINSAATGNPVDNVTFHQNNARSGWYSAESTLTVANVASSSFGMKGSLVAPAGMPAFGKIYAQPLFVSKQVVADGSTHDLVIISTSTDQVYAFDEQTRALVWHRDFTNPAAGIRQQLYGDTGCADISPDVGIIGTPVIDRALNTMYVVVPTSESGVAHERLHALNLANGADALAPREVVGSMALASGGTASIDPKRNLNRSALLEANGNIYVALGSHCDYSSGTVHGWIVAYTANALAPAGNLVNTTDLDTGGGHFLGAIWMSGYGPAADAQGNVYFSTGNGPFDGRADYSMSVLRLPGTLDITKAGSFTPATWQNDSNADRDLGSGGVMLLPDQSGAHPHLLLQGGKSGQKYLLDRENLGGLQTGDAGAVWQANTGGGIWGGPAYFQDANGAQYVVYGGGNPLSTYQLLAAPLSLGVQSSANVGCLECRDKGSQPIVSSNGTAAGTAVAWALKTPGNSGGSISLYAFDALAMSHTLFAGTAGVWNQVPGTPWIGGALVSPTVANGHVYVPTDGAVAIFGVQ